MRVYSPKFENHVIAKRIPESDIRNTDRIRVEPTYEAIVLNEGDIKEILRQGTHQVESINTPLFDWLYNKVLYGGEASFPVQLIFVLTNLITLKFGDSSEFFIKLLGLLIPVETRGSLNISIVDVRRFYLNLLGTKDIYTISDLDQFVKTLVMQEFRCVISEIFEHEADVFSLPSKAGDICARVKDKVNNALGEYGLQIKLINATCRANENSDAMRELRTAWVNKKTGEVNAEATREKVVISGVPYAVERSFNILDELATNSNGGDTFSAVLAGSAGGVAAGSPIVKKVIGTVLKPSGTESVACISCNAKIQAGDNFCSNCGVQQVKTEQ